MKQLLEFLKLPVDLVNKILIALAAAGAMFVGAMIYNTSRLEQQEQRYIEEMRVFKQKADSALHHADSLERLSDAYNAKSDSAVRRARQSERAASQSKARTDSMKNELEAMRQTISDSVQMAREIIPRQESIIAQQDETIQLKTEENGQLLIALVQKDSALILSNTRGDSLETVIRNIPTPPKPPTVGKLKRTTVFIAGVATGIFADAVIFRRR